MNFFDEQIGFIYNSSEQIGFENYENKDFFKHGKHKTKELINAHILDKGVQVSPSCSLFKREIFNSSLLVDIPNKVGYEAKHRAIGNDVLIYLIASTLCKYFYKNNFGKTSLRSHEKSISTYTEYSELLSYYLLAKAFLLKNIFVT